MANRRMFSLKIIDTDNFLQMPNSARLLYYDLAMRADDDGFIDSPQKIVKMTNASVDDLKILAAKKYIIPFDSGICVIRHWRIHNYIQKDRYDKTIYETELSALSLDKNGMYTECIQNVSKLDTQVRLGKDRLGKDIKALSSPMADDQKNEPGLINDKEKREEQPDDKIEYMAVIKAFNEICHPPMPKVEMLTNARKSHIKHAWDNRFHCLDGWYWYFDRAAKSNWLSGKTIGRDGKSFKCCFDWLLKSSNMVKVLEGNYDNN